MWSDTLLLVERAHLARLLAWGATSLIVGTALVALLAWRRAGSPLLTHFGIQTAAWGALDVALAASAWRGLAERDASGAARLEHLLWFDVGLDTGCVAVGATLALAGWAMGRRLGAVGAGIGIAVQGLALVALHARLLSVIPPLG
jgi:hypothetical protein